MSVIPYYAPHAPAPAGSIGHLTDAEILRTTATMHQAMVSMAESMVYVRALRIAVEQHPDHFRALAQATWDAKIGRRIAEDAAAAAEDHRRAVEAQVAAATLELELQMRTDPASATHPWQLKVAELRTQLAKKDAAIAQAQAAAAHETAQHAGTQRLLDQALQQLDQLRDEQAEAPDYERHFRAFGQGAAA